MNELSVEVVAQTPETAVVQTPVDALSARVAEQDKRIAELQAALDAITARKGGNGGSRHGTWQGMTPTALLRGLGFAGWSQVNMAKVLQALGFRDVTPATVSTQHGWGRQWAKGNVKCGLKHKPYGSKPVVLTAGQLAELEMLAGGSYVLLSQKPAA